MPDEKVPSALADFARRSLPETGDAFVGTYLHQSGEMRLAPNRPWVPFTAEQWYDSDRIGFKWRARVHMAPLLKTFVEDAYEEGLGRLDAKIWGLIPVARARGPEIDRSEMQRYLAELAWCPPALLRNPDLHFHQPAQHTVRVWGRDPAATVDLRLDAHGDIVGARTEARWRGGVGNRPWEGRFSEYKSFDGLRVPTRGEVWWETQQGRFVYWQGTVHDALLLRQPMQEAR